MGLAYLAYLQRPFKVKLFLRDYNLWGTFYKKKLIFIKLINIVPLEQCHHRPIKATIHTHPNRFVMELLQWHKICKISGDKLHRTHNPGCLQSMCMYGWISCLISFFFYFLKQFCLPFPQRLIFIFKDIVKHGIKVVCFLSKSFYIMAAPVFKVTWKIKLFHLFEILVTRNDRNDTELQRTWKSVKTC